MYTAQFAIVISRHPAPFVTHPFLKALQSASVAKVVGALVQTFDLQFQLGFTKHPVNHVSLHEAAVSCYAQVLVEQVELPAVNPHNAPVLSLIKEHPAKDVVVLENPDT